MPPGASTSAVEPVSPQPRAPAHPLTPPALDCQSCGACCATSREWPRFSLESDREIELIPEALREPNGMACRGDRCLALVGEVGRHTACGIYAVRPIVCRECEPGDPECRMARARFGLPTG